MSTKKKKLVKKWRKLTAQTVALIALVGICVSVIMTKMLLILIHFCDVIYSHFTWRRPKDFPG